MKRKGLLIRYDNDIWFSLKEFGKVFTNVLMLHYFVCVFLIYIENTTIFYPINGSVVQNAFYNYTFKSSYSPLWLDLIVLTGNQPLVSNHQKARLRKVFYFFSNKPRRVLGCKGNFKMLDIKI